MTLKDIAKLEETHYPVECQFFSPDGLTEQWTEVCSYCDQYSDTCGAVWPCEIIDEAYWEYENSRSLNGWVEPCSNSGQVSSQA